MPEPVVSLDSQSAQEPKQALPAAWLNRKGMRIGIVVAITVVLGYGLLVPTPTVQVPVKRQAEGTQDPVSATAVQQAQKAIQDERLAVAAKAAEVEKLKAVYAKLGISIDDLDLSTPDGQAALRNRVEEAEGKRTAATIAQQATGAGDSAGGAARTRNRQSDAQWVSGEGIDGGAKTATRSGLSNSIVFDDLTSKGRTTTATAVSEGVAERAEMPGSERSNRADEPRTHEVGMEASGSASSSSERPATQDRQLSKTRSLLDIDLANARYILPENTVFEGVLTNKLVGDAVGPVNVMLTTPVYALGTHVMIMPAGSQLIGEAKSLSGFGESRLAVFFHRVLIHDGSRLYSVPFDQVMPALDMQGAVGIKGETDQHILQSIAISGVVGAIGGLANLGNSSSGLSTTSLSQYRSGIAESMSQSSAQILNRFLNQKPRTTVQPGTRVKLMTTYDLRFISFDEGIRNAKVEGGQ